MGVAAPTIVYAEALDGGRVQPGKFKLEQKNKSFGPHLLAVPAACLAAAPHPAAGAAFAAAGQLSGLGTGRVWDVAVDPAAPAVMLAASGLPVKVVTGYGSTARILLALEQGEVDAVFTVEDSFAHRAHLIRESARNIPRRSEHARYWKQGSERDRRGVVDLSAV